MYAYNQNDYRKSAHALNGALGKHDYLVGNTFSVTDIIVSWTCQFGYELGYNDGFEYIAAYLDRVKGRPNCTLTH